MNPTIAHKIILGTAQLGMTYGINNTQGEPNEARAHEVLALAHHYDIKTLDTADAYQKASLFIGNFHRKEQKQFQIITKFKLNFFQKKINQWVEDTLKTLGIAALSCCMFHTFDEYMQQPEWMDELRKMKQLGKIKRIGLSIYTNEEFEKAIDDADIEVIQLPYNILDNNALRGNLMKKAKEKQKIIHVRSVFLQGLLYMSFPQFPEKLKPLIPYLTLIKEKMESMNSMLTLQKLSLNYALHNPNINAVVLGVESAQQLRENMDAIVAFENELPSLYAFIDTINVKEKELLLPINW
jgi:uncharacterized protein